MAVSLRYSSSMFLPIFFVTTYFIHLVCGQTCSFPTNSSVAFFNGSAYARVNTTFDIKGTSFRFRTCVGGTILQQTGANGDSLSLTADVLSEKLSISWRSGVVEGLHEVDAVLNSGEISLLFQESLGSITLQINDKSEVTLATTGGLNNELFSLDLQGSFLTIGENFTGCVNDYYGTSSQGLQLCTTFEHENVVWGQCQLDNIVSCDPCIADTPCQNNGTCSSILDVYTCECTARYSGDNCEIDDGLLCDRIDTEFAKNCTNNGTCIEDPTGNFTTCHCPSGYEGTFCENETDYCASDPCTNNATCTNILGGYNCTCPEGLEGTRCETNINDCIGVQCQNGGTCIDGVDSYTCDCPSGYEGPLCGVKVDLCQSSPCENEGQCVDLGTEYDCICVRGYTGPNCELDLEECSSNPCQNNGTCNEYFDFFNCTCLEGFEGEVCDAVVCREDSCDPTFECQVNGSGIRCVCPLGSVENAGSCEDINECDQNPCQNNGACQNLVNMYTCDCTGTGFEGDQCETPIDECASTPCQNNGTCTDQVNGYVCACHGGYSGDNCQEDDNECSSSPCENGGMCLENSNASYYADDSEYKTYFPGNFDYANAEGFTCACQPGFTGDFCEEDVDECGVMPCQNGGSCTDGVNNFTCACLLGWEGVVCTEEIKCDTDPCQNGATCEDNIPNGGYRCICPEGYDGDHCEEELLGCVGVTCSNGGTCVPVYGESQGHSFACDCVGGFRGDSCDIPTPLSFLPGHSGITDDSTFKDVTLDYTLTFGTTLSSGLLLFAGVRDDFFRLELLNGRLKLTVRYGREDITESVVLGVGLNDGEWHKVNVNMTESSLTLSVSTDVPSSNAGETCMNGFCQVVEVLEQPYSLGAIQIGAPGVNVEGDSFIGCMRDVANIGEGEFFDQTTIIATSELLHGCNRVEQCDNMTCAGNGACNDLWWESSCDCNSGYTGPNCTDMFVVGSFSFENSTSYAVFDSVGSALSPLENIVRFQFRTRQASGLLFLAQNATDYISIYLTNGQLKAEVSLASESVDVTVGSALNDGIFHVVYFSRQGANVSLVVDSAEDTTEMSDSYETFFNNIYVGGVDDFSVLPSSLRDVGYFKGCLWDVKYNQYSLQFFPLAVPTEIESLPVSLTNVLDNECASDDLCRSMPCMNGGTCNNEGLWNEFLCDCPYGFTGATCENETICGPTRNPCPGKVTCIEKGDSYECVVEATFEESRLRYEHSLNLTTPLETITFRMRTRYTHGVIFRAEASEYFVTIDITDSVLFIRFNLGESVDFDTRFRVDDGSWHDVRVDFASNGVSVEVDNMTVDMSVQLNSDLRVVLMDSYTVTVGGVDLPTASQFSNVIGFVGCLEDFRFGDHLLPFFNETVYSPDLGEQFVIIEGEVPLGCTGEDVCGNDKHDCQNGVCVDEWNRYSCNCTAGYEGTLCDMEINECESVQCVNEGTCLDQLDDYLCLCLSGYSGKNCEANINECASDPCQNGGTCNDLIDEFECQCPTNFTGKWCEFMVQITCDEDICENNSTCVPKNDTSVGEDAFTCLCQPGYTGSRCSYPINYCDNVTCENGGTCSSNMVLQTHNCSCVLGFEGQFCETDIEDCTPTICQNGGTCEDMINDYECDCVPGFTGKMCQDNIDDCFPDPCYAGTCNDGVDTFTCDCPDGYEGTRCENDIDECTRFSPCQNGAACINLEGGYTCECPPNFFGNNCQSSPCLSNPCINGACTAQNATHYVCNCSEGYGGSACSVADCSLVTSCQNGGSCQEDVDRSAWTCLCPEYIEGELCQFKGPCSELVCQNGANCSQTLTGNLFEGGCECLQGYTGFSCETEIDWCASGPCENQANCSNTPQGPVCTCNPGFGGDFCENELPNCASSLCQNGANCTDFDFRYECDCASGFNGTNCEVNIDDCPNNLCENGAECVDGVNNYTCDCTGTGFQGIYCLEDIDECASDPCQNGGTCQNSVNEFKCECVEPYLPPTCETMSPCESSPCSNGGECKGDETNPEQFVCDCTSNYEGLTCETFIGNNPNNTPWGLIGGIIGGVVLIVLLILLILLFLNIRKQRATAGTYSPSRQEISGSRVEMDNVLKLPPPERLI